VAKSSLILGLGEERDEGSAAMAGLHAAGEGDAESRFPAQTELTREADSGLR
jgi:hypothetical protein